MKPSEPIRQYAEDKVGKLDKLIDDRGEVHVTLSVERREHLARIELAVAGALRVRADDRSEDMYGSIDTAIEKVVRQVKRYRSKVRDWQREPKGRVVPHQVLHVSHRVDESGEDTLEKPQVVRQETIVAKEMSVDDAVLQMDLLNSDFLVYTDMISHQVNVMYRLADGHYGLIEAQLGT